MIIDDNEGDEAINNELKLPTTSQGTSLYIQLMHSGSPNSGMGYNCAQMSDLKSLKGKMET